MNRYAAGWVKTAVAAAAVLTVNRNVVALTFHLTYDSTVTNSPYASEIESDCSYVAQQYSSLYQAPVTVNINVYEDPNIALGESHVTDYGYTYAQVYQALGSHINSPNEALAFSSLSSTDPTGGGTFYLTYAQRRLLGLASATDSTLDGQFSFQPDYNYAFDPNNRAIPGYRDFIGVAEHEFTEILGRSSALESGAYSIYDLYRYDSAGTRSFSTADPATYFSIDGGQTALHTFHNNVGGNSGDLGDWDESTIDSFDAASGYGAVYGLSPEDLVAVDVIGGNEGTDGTNVYWKPVQGNFSTAANWVGGSAPGAGSIAQFRLAGPSYTVSLTANVTTAGLYVHDNDFIINLAGHTWTQSPSTINPLIVSQNAGDTGTLFIDNGTMVTNVPTGYKSQIGAGAGTNGYVQLNESTWTNNGTLVVGDGASGPHFNADGIGTLYVTSGSTFNENGLLSLGGMGNTNGSLYTSGTVNINSVETHIGEYGTGSLYVQGGTVTDSQNFLVGVYSGCHGLVDISAGTVLANGGYTFVGYGGAGTVEVEQQGSLQVGGTLTLGQTTSGLGTLILGYVSSQHQGAAGSQTGAILSVTGDEVIGVYGTGFYYAPLGATFIQNSGSNTCATLTVAQQTGSTAYYQMSGGSISSATILIGDGGTGTFNQSAGMVTITPALAGVRIGDLSTGTGSYSLSGSGSLNVPYVTVGNAGVGTFNLTGGSLNAPLSLFIGSIANSTGQFLQSGGSSTTGYLDVGASGTGTLNQSAGSQTVAGPLIIGDQNGSTGSAIINGGSLVASSLTIAGSPTAVGSLTFGGTGSILIGSGTPSAGPALVIASGAQLITAGTATINANGATANYGSVNVNSGSLTYNGTIFNNSGTITVAQNATLSILGTSLQNFLVNFATINVATGGTLKVFNLQNNNTATINGALQVGSNFINLGTASILGPQQWAAGSLFTNDGTATFGTDAGASGANLAIDGNYEGAMSYLYFNSTQHLLSLTLARGGNATLTGGGNGHRSILVTGTLGLQGGKLDLTGNDLDLQSGSLTLITASVKAAFNKGAWTGNGVTSSTAANDSRHMTALGIMQNNQSGNAMYTPSRPFDGTMPGPGDILVKYTYYGDADLSGVVDGSDYSHVDVAFLADRTNPAPDTGWFNGDFNYDGFVNGSDYTLMDNAFNTQSVLEASQLATPTAVIGSATAVPEPASLAFLALSGVAALSRRRGLTRRHCE